MSTRVSRRASSHCRADGTRETRAYNPVNTVRLNFEAWADAVEGRAPYRFSIEQLRDNIRILDAVTPRRRRMARPSRSDRTHAPGGTMKAFSETV